jgi:hypothetical protein
MALNKEKPIAYTNLDWAERSAIMDELKVVGSEMYQGHLGDGFTAAIGKGALYKTHVAMAKYGFVPRHTVTFPLGTDKPAQHLRHDEGQFKSCQWLLCTYALDTR